MKLNFTILIILFCILCPKTKAQTYYLKTSGTFTSLSSWTTDPTGVASIGTPTSFTAANCSWHFANRTGTLSLNSTNHFTFVSTSTVYIDLGLTLKFNTGGRFYGDPEVVVNSTIIINASINPLAIASTTFNTGSVAKFTSGTTIWAYNTPYYNLYSCGGSKSITGYQFANSAGTTFSVTNNFYIGDGLYPGDQYNNGDEYVFNSSFTTIRNFTANNLYILADDVSITNFTVTNITIGDGIAETVSGFGYYNGNNTALGVLTSTNSNPSSVLGNITDNSPTYTLTNSTAANPTTTYSNVIIAGTIYLNGPRHSIESCTITNATDQSSISSTYSNVEFTNNLYLQGTGTYSVLTNLVVGGTFSLSATNGFSLNPTNTTPITFSANSCVLNTNLILEAGTATISGALSGSGNIVGDGSASLVLDQSSSGTLNIASPYELSKFTITGSPSITLGTNLYVIGTGEFNLLGGTLVLNGNTLSIGSSVTASLTSGCLSDNGTSTFSLQTPDIGTGLRMDVITPNNTLKALITNGNLSLFNALNIKDYIQIDGGTLTTGGNLTLTANNSLSARVASLSSGVISGNVTVETYIPGGSAGWSLLGSGGLTGVTINDWDDDFDLTCLDCAASSYTAVNGSFFASIQSYDEPGSALFTSINQADVITPGKGFWVYVGINTLTANPFTISNTYTLNQGDITYPITNSGNGYNLIANPYASPIDFDLFRAQNSSLILTTMYGHNRTVSGSYVVGGAGTNGVNRIIPAGQAFYVRASSAGTATFTEAMKITNNTSANPVLRSSSLAHNLKLKIKASDNNSDETIIASSSNASLDYDIDYDCKKINLAPSYFGVSNNKLTSISTKIGNNVFSINDIGVITNTITIPLLAKALMPGQYTISAEDASNFEGCVIIKDKLLNVYNDLIINPYIFNLNDTNSSNRFELILCPFNKSVSVKELNESNNILISQDENGAFVKTFFEQNTKTVISVYNILGQKIAKDIILNEASAITRLDINNHNQIIFVKVVANNQSLTKKIVSH